MKTEFSVHKAVASARRRAPVLAGVALIGALAVGTTMVAAGSLTAKTVEPVRAVSSIASPIDFSSVIERVSPAVVNIQVSSRAPGAMARAEAPKVPKDMEEFFHRFFGDQFGQGGTPPGHGTRGPVMQALGSGFIIDSDGLIVTNHHVINGAEKITVTLRDRRSFTATLVGSDPDTDLALLRIKGAGDLPWVSFSKGPTPRPGEWVIALGNPFGLDHTATAGIVSATGRAIGAGPYDDFIQIDAPINKGNSGGPTFNLAGEVVGVNTAIFSPTGGSVGIGFAIPATTARNVIAQLKATGAVERGWLGVEVQQITPDIADGLGLDRPRGALVASVVADGPAAKAGLSVGDLIVAIDGAKIERMRALPRAVAAVPPGRDATLEVLRGGARKTITVVVGKRPASKVALAGPAATGKATGKVLGMRLARAKGGVAVVAVDPEGPAASHGIARGDVIAAVANKAVQAPGDVVRGIEAARKAGRKAVLLLLDRDGTHRFVALPLRSA